MIEQFNNTELLRQFDDAFAAVAAEQTGPVPRYKPLNKPERKVFPFLYLPVEVKAREFESKALIARDAKALGFTVILGASWVLSAWISHLPPGIRAAEVSERDRCREFDELGSRRDDDRGA